MNRLEQTRHWFIGLEKREQWVIGGGAVILLLVIVYGAMLAPYLNHRQQLIARVQQRRALLAWMRPKAREIESLHTAPPQPLPGGSLLGTVNATAASAGLGNVLRQAHQDTNGSVQAQFSDVDFDELVRWLNTLRVTYGIVPSAMTVTRTTAPGVVNVNIRLKGAGQ